MITEWIGVVISFAAGLLGIIFAGIANSRAKKSNKIAQAANDLAAQAVAQAREANDIAEDANKLSEDANSIAFAQAAQENDPSYVEWGPKWDGNNAVLTLRNTGSNTAHNLTVAVSGDEIYKRVDGLGDIPGGREASITLVEVAEKKVRDRSVEDARLRDLAARGFTVAGRPWSLNVGIIILWESDIGKPGVKKLQLTLR